MTRNNKVRLLGPVLLALLLPATPGGAQNDDLRTALYRDPAAPVAARVDDLLRRMTQAEKIAQLRVIWTTKTRVFDDAMQFDPARASALLPDGLGGFARPADRDGAGSPRLKPLRDGRQTVALTNAIQRWAVEKTRLGIPVLFHEEGLHGYVARDTTNFPIPIGLASTFNPGLVRQLNSVTAREMRARGVTQALSPVVDVARDPRWGRIEETFGEDPYLAGEMGVAAVEGLQGTALPRWPTARSSPPSSISPAMASPRAAPMSGRRKSPSAPCGRISSRPSPRWCGAPASAP